MAERKTTYGFGVVDGLIVGWALGAAVTMGFWAYHDFQPDPLPRYIGCTIGEGPNAGQECPPLKLKDGEYVPWDA